MISILLTRWWWLLHLKNFKCRGGTNRAENFSSGHQLPGSISHLFFNEVDPPSLYTKYRFVEKTFGQNSKVKPLEDVQGGREKD